MGPSIQSVHRSQINQVASGRLGRRTCLLKGCERIFRPVHALSRYCCRQCVAAAARWRQRMANRRYRASEHGKQRRQEQSKRYRQRRDAERDSSYAPLSGGEGYGYGGGRKKIRCHRPGCYECFEASSRSPLQRFCNALCRAALRRVLVRERRWLRTWTRARDKGCQSSDSW